MTYNSVSCFEAFRGTAVRQAQSIDHLNLKQKQMWTVGHLQKYITYIRKKKKTTTKTKQNTHTQKETTKKNNGSL